jgi:spermidine synthase
VDVDTQYNRVLIFNSTDRNTGRPIKMLRVNDENSSAMFLDGDEGLVFKVLEYYHLVEHFVPTFQHSLMIGGSGYAFPKEYLKTYPEAKLDVVEIDPGLTALAREHFELKDNPRLNIFHEDGRIFLNHCNDHKYDAVFMDAYRSMLTIPYQLTTQEAVQKISDALSDEGAVFANVISSLDDNKSEFLRAELATYRSVFPQVFLFAVQYPKPTEVEKLYFQNIMLVGLKSQLKPELVSENEKQNGFLSNLVEIKTSKKDLIMTDEFAPVEYFASKVLN